MSEKGVVMSIEREIVKCKEFNLCEKGKCICAFCDGYCLYHEEYLCKNSQEGTRLETDEEHIERLNILLDEANASLAMAREDGKRAIDTARNAIGVIKKLIRDPDCLCDTDCGVECGSDECIDLMIKRANKEG